MPRDPFLTRRAREFRNEKTAAETRVWWMLRARRFADLKFRRQHVLGNYIADFVCIAARLVIEIDGATHGEDESKRDAKRTEEIERAGYRVIRFNNHYVMDDRDGDVAEMILEALRTSSLPEKEKAMLETEGRIQ
jgi:very-short-patch-repair endonuclease